MAVVLGVVKSHVLVLDECKHVDNSIIASVRPTNFYATFSTTIYSNAQSHCTDISSNISLLFTLGMRLMLIEVFQCIQPSCYFFLSLPLQGSHKLNIIRRA